MKMTRVLRGGEDDRRVFGGDEQWRHPTWGRSNLAHDKRAGLQSRPATPTDQRQQQRDQTIGKTLPYSRNPRRRIYQPKGFGGRAYPRWYVVP